MYLAILNFIVILALVGAGFSIFMMQRGVMAARSAERRFNEAREALNRERRQIRQQRSALAKAPGVTTVAASGSYSRSRCLRSRPGEKRG